MACGSGMFDIAFAGTILVILTLVSIRVLERKVLPTSTKKNRRIKVGLVCANENAQKIQEYIIDKYPSITELTKKQLVNDSNAIKITCVIDVATKKPIKDLYKVFQKQQGIDSISIQETLD